MVEDVSELVGASVRLRPVTKDDRDALIAIRSTPEVWRWWRGDDVAADVDDAFVDDELEQLAVTNPDGDVIGLVQFTEEVDADYRHAAIDIFIVPEVHRRGYGVDALRTLAGHLMGSRGHHRLTIDPVTTNTAAIACYEKAGFRRVGVMAQYEKQDDGSWADGLLMELVQPQPGPDGGETPPGGDESGP